MSTGSFWVDQLRSAYEEGETDGVIALAAAKSEESRRQYPNWPTPPDLVRFAFEAAQSKRGPTASMIHAWLAACFLQNQDEYAWDLWSQVEENQDCPVQADMVTHCLALANQASSNCSTTSIQSSSDVATMAQRQERMGVILERATKASKKQAGSKRRRAMAKARRQQPQKHQMGSACSFEERVQQVLNQKDFEILCETDDLLVVNKPAGVSCFHQKAASKRDVSLEQALVQVNAATLSTLNPQARGLVHRLDRGTSGCLVLAKTEKAHALLVTEFFCRRVSKKYTCLVESIPTPPSGRIDLPVDGRPAQSRYRVEQVWEEQQQHAPPMALLAVETLTGRKHQVRIHCAKGLGCPILGDEQYGASSLTSITNVELLPKGSFFLHASSLAIPSFGIDVQAPLPKTWSRVMDEERGHEGQY